MKLELSQAAFSPLGLATIAIVTAMLEAMPVGEQRLVLARAAVLVPEGSGARREEARRMIGAMFAQTGA